MTDELTPWIPHSRRVECPVCKQPVGKKCRTLKTNRVTDTHIARLDLSKRVSR